jgi:hypothetical protein
MTVDKWKDLPKAVRRMVKDLIAKGNFKRAMAYRTTGMTKSGLDRIERTKGKIVAPQNKRLQ